MSHSTEMKVRHRNTPFGKRQRPIAEFASLEEIYEKGEVSKRSERAVRVYLTPALAIMLLVLLSISPESRAMALDLASKGVELGWNWVLRSTID